MKVSVPNQTPSYTGEIIVSPQTHELESFTLLPQRMQDFISKQLEQEDVTLELFNLVHVGILTHELAFNGGLSKENFLAIASLTWDLGVEKRKTGVRVPSSKNQDDSSSLDKATTAIEWLIITCPHISKEQGLTFIEEAWETGKRQKKIYNMEIEGSINNEYGIALNFACYIAMLGQRKGLLSVTQD